MDVTRPFRIGIWIAWLLIFPAASWYIYQQYPPTISGFEIDVFVFLVFMCIVATLPIIVNDTPIFFTHGVSLAVFLVFGLFVEMVLFQIAILVLLLKVHVTRNNLFRLPMNSLMFLIVSVIGAVVYYSLGGQNGIIQLNSVASFIPIVGYIASTFLANNILIHIIRRVVYKRDDHFFTRDLLWEAMTSLLVIPVGVVLYLLYIEIGIISTFYIGIPFLSIAIILQLYHSSQQVNSYLQKVSEIGHQLTERLEVDQVLSLFLAKLTKTLQVDYAYIIDVKRNYSFEVLRYFELGEDKMGNGYTFDQEKGISGYIYQTSKPVLFKTSKEWNHLALANAPEQAESLIGVPIKRNQKIVGIIILLSNKKRAYEGFHLTIVDILANYLAVAIENARHYEEAKKISEHCALTKLYNYRYFENKLEEEFIRLTSSKLAMDLSLILLDIDHFKGINDTYGHQAGNEVLFELARRLEKSIGSKGTVARYGGEEFAILLPGFDPFASYEVAEQIRQAISSEPFIINHHLAETNQEVEVKITASIGVATAPEDADDPMTLIRHADRAMYTGAKQQGRNKVAQYVK
ncbi:diguanylate cyclase (GGDEF)-like protein [Bacillus mesophilus]|uniref:Diguanylate cyclase n=1 Tax=Bacillus mesophilus TaxID=1808955 RepID=A0A6M0Q654_9BACI|nr:sensor domain-containing diguanylate cyclase [Bacillus mesophilus]MBM7660650.1 diguanylate cyclase (GGDEF)-like protein [Bacillus mesophilus]NEY71802.1 diguanylate cyclase [Bacillus mesophilus]